MKDSSITTTTTPRAATTAETPESGLEDLRRLFLESSSDRRSAYLEDELAHRDLTQETAWSKITRSYQNVIKENVGLKQKLQKLKKRGSKRRVVSSWTRICKSSDDNASPPRDLHKVDTVLRGGGPFAQDHVRISSLLDSVHRRMSILEEYIADCGVRSAPSRPRLMSPTTHYQSPPLLVQSTSKESPRSTASVSIEVATLSKVYEAQLWVERNLATAVDIIQHPLLPPTDLIVGQKLSDCLRTVELRRYETGGFGHTSCSIPLTGSLLAMQPLSTDLTCLVAQRPKSTRGCQLALVDLVRQAEFTRSATVNILGPPACLGHTGSWRTFFSFHLEQSAFLVWDFRAASKAAVNSINLGMTPGSPAQAAVYHPPSSSLFIAHEKGLVAKWRVAYPARGTPVTFVESFRVPHEIIDLTLIDFPSSAIAEDPMAMLALTTTDVASSRLIFSPVYNSNVSRPQHSSLDSLLMPSRRLSCRPALSFLASAPLLSIATPEYLEVWNITTREQTARTTLGHETLSSLRWLSSGLLVSADTAGNLGLWAW